MKCKLTYKPNSPDWLVTLPSDPSYTLLNVEERDCNLGDIMMHERGYTTFDVFDLWDEQGKD